MSTSIIATYQALKGTKDTAMPAIPEVATPAELGAITQTEINQVITDMVVKWDLKGIKVQDILEIFEYQGFDPKIIYRHIAVMKKRAVDPLSDDIVKEDIALMLILQQIKGNISAKNFNGLSDQAKELCINLYKRWGISMKVPAAKKKTAITLPRIAAAFPLQSSMIAKTVISNFMGPFASSSLPDFMKTASFPSLIPLGKKATDLIIFCYNCYATDQQIVLSGKNRAPIDKADLAQLFDNQLNFTMVSYNSSVMDDSARKEAMKTLGMNQCFKELEKVLIATGQRKIHDMSENDFILNTTNWA